jgi:hypothetical protein
MPNLKEATTRPTNLGEVITPTAQNLPPLPVNPAGDPGLAIGSLGPAPSMWTDPYSSVRQWKRNGVSQQRFPVLPTKADPQKNAAASSVSARKIAPVQLQVTSNTAAIAAIPSTLVEAWDGSKNYVAGNQVQSAGNVFQALQNNVGNIPPTPPATSAFWINIGPSTLDNLPNGQAYLRDPQYGGPNNFAANGNFEASTTLPPPGWVAGSATLSYETVSPQSGNQSLIVNAPAQFGNAQSAQKYACKAGDAFQVAGFIMQASNVGSAIQLIFFNAAGAQISSVSAGTSATGAWTFVSGTGVAPVNTVYAQLFCIISGVSGGIGKFDNIFAVRQLTPFELTPISTSGTPTSTTGLCTQSGSTTTINIAASTWQFGSGQINYNGGTINPGFFGKFYIFADDPSYSGGAITYQITITPSVCNAATGRIVFGSIITVSGGGAVSQGGGSGGGGPLGKGDLGL